MESFPTFNVVERRASDNGVSLFGAVSSTQFGNETWIGDLYLAFLKSGDLLVYGRWHIDGERWQFTVDASKTSEHIPADNSFQILDGYWGERAELVLDRNIVWRRELWQAQDDHDHCAICWETISSIENQTHFAASTGERVCNACYEAYVSRRALTFIPVAT